MRAAPRRSISAVVRSDPLVSAAAAPSLSARSLSSSSGGHSYYQAARSDPRRLSMNDATASDCNRAGHLKRQSLHQQAAELTAYYSFSRRRGSLAASEDQAGLSGFLEYRRLDGSWRPFLFQTIGYQLVVFRVQVTQQVQVMTTDIRDASEIALVQDEGDLSNSKLFRLGINNTVITLRAVSHHVAMYWIEGLRALRAGNLPDLQRDRLTIESEDDIFRQIDQMTQLREWRPPPSTEAPYCGLCLPCVGWFCLSGLGSAKEASSAMAFATTLSPTPNTRPPAIQENRAWV